MPERGPVRLLKKRFQSVVFDDSQIESKSHTIHERMISGGDARTVDMAKLDSRLHTIADEANAALEPSASRVRRIIMSEMRKHPNGIGYGTLRSRIPSPCASLFPSVVVALEQAGHIRIVGRLVQRGERYHEAF